MLLELQQYLRQAAAQHRTVVRSGPFLAHIDAHADQPYANYAIPDAGAEPSADDVAALMRLLAEHERRPALEFLPACAPAVQPALAEAGFAVTARIPLMTTDAERLVALVPPDGLTVALVDADADDELAREICAVQNAAFGIPDAPVGDEDVARLRGYAAEGVVAYALEADAIVGAGMALTIRDGLTEVVGIAVAEHARGRGVAGALTSATARAAVARGAHLPFLTPGHDQAGRAYARAGFATAGEMLHMARPEAASGT